MFVAGFVGVPPMNFLEQDGVVMGFRPEAFAPTELIPGKDAMKFRFRVEWAENLGAYKLVYGTIGDTRVIVNISPRYSLEDGREYDFGVRAQDVRYFDKKSGVRIKR
jgi:ABC-type sugar transport system ATPase subunit